MTDEVQDTPKSARSEGARNGWKTRQKNKQDAPAKVGGISEADAKELRDLYSVVLTASVKVGEAEQFYTQTLERLNRKLDSLTAGK